MVSGVIDRLLITRCPDASFEVEIIDFKTNRMSGASSSSSDRGRLVRKLPPALNHRTMLRFTNDYAAAGAQFAFNFDVEFDAGPSTTVAVAELEPPISDALRMAAQDYQLQMQSYVNSCI